MTMAINNFYCIWKIKKFHTVTVTVNFMVDLQNLSQGVRIML